MEFVYQECFAAKHLLEAPEEGISEKELMDKIWKDLSEASKDLNKMIDIPLRREDNGRIPAVVYTLKNWLGRGVIEIDLSKHPLCFKVGSRLILSETIKDYEKD